MAAQGLYASPTLAWDSRLLAVEGDPLRYRLAATTFKPQPQQIAALRDRVCAALDAEAGALDALEAEAARQLAETVGLVAAGC